MTVGKSRLLTGIACVGSLVVLAVAILANDVAGEIFPATPQTPPGEMLALICFMVAITGIMLPFDIVGGLIIPTIFETHSPEVGRWFRRWGRSVALQTAFYSLTLFFYLQIGREVGAPWLIALFAVLQVGLLSGQELLWRLMTGNRPTEADMKAVSFVQSDDPRFVGGITGLPGLESILLPDHWRFRLRHVDLRTLVIRRKSAMSSGARLRGIMTAMFWNVFSFASAILLSGASVVSVADIVNLFLWFLLLSFGGLLLLPTFSRSSVFALDRRVAEESGVDELCRAILAVDALTERDSQRSAAAESVFQPIPCPERRVAALNKATQAHTGAWNVARLALFLSWAFGGPLARAVHCNVGRPELWAILPAD